MSEIGKNKMENNETGIKAQMDSDKGFQSK